MAYQKICISSGHGLYVRGAGGCMDEVDEARRMVEHLADVIDARGIKVIEYHDNVSKNQSDNLNAIVNAHNKAAPDLNISLHFNAFDTKAHGCEVLYKTQDRLAQDLSDAIASVGFTNRGGKKRDDLKFLNSTHGPAVLLEVCFCDNEGDSKLYKERFGEICDRIVDVLAGEGEDEIDLPEPGTPEQPEDEFLFYARGKCSHFGGPDDTGVSSSEGLAFIYSLDETNQHLFLPLQPKGTTGLARRLNAKAVHYIACRWSYEVTPKEMLASQKYVAMVTVPSTGLRLTAWPADWGPHEEKTGGRVADLSPALMADLELETDDEVIVEFPWQG